MNKLIVFCVISILSMMVSIAADESIKEKAQKLADELYKIEKMGGDQLKYSKHALDILRKVFFVTPDGYVEPSTHGNWMTPANQEVDTFSLLSGGLAIRESLQLDSITAMRSEQATVDINTLEAPQIESHPFMEMVKDKKWKSFSLAASAPYDFYYFHFNNMKRILDFLDYLESVGGSLHQRFTPHAVDFGVKDKILTQLALRITPEARKFYDTVIEEMAVVGSDPFFLEGTDVTLVYRLKNPIAFKMTMSLYRTYFTLKHGAKEQEFNIGKDEVSYLSNADGSVNSYLVRLPNNIAILSNSRKALETVLDTYYNKRQSLQRSYDFRYMRSIYLADEKSEDGFLYLSDPFIHHLISPQLRIKESRRMAESIRIASLERYVILYFQLYDQLPQNIEELISRLSLPETKNSEKLDEFRKGKNWESLKAYAQNYYYLLSYDLESFIQEVANSLHWANHDYERVYEEGEQERELEAVVEKVKAIVAETQSVFSSITGREFTTIQEAFTILEQSSANETLASFEGLELIPGSFSVRSKEYGKMGYLVPNLETEITTVSTQEAEAYRSFSENYTNYWRTYFDPIGVRISMRETVKIETCILPLINNSIYDALTNILGGAPVQLATTGIDGEVASFGIKIDKQKLLGSLGEDITLDQLDQEIGRELGISLRMQDMLDTIGDEIEIHALDNTPLVDFEGSALLQDMMRWGARNIESATFALLGYSIFHPLRVSISVNDEAKAEELLNHFDKVFFLWKQQQNQKGWDRWGPRFDNYSIFYQDGKKFRSVKISFAGLIHFHLFYVVHNGKIHMTTTQEYMKKILADNTPNTNDITSGNIRAIMRPSQMQKERDSYETTIIESAKDASYKNFGTIYLLSLLFLEKNNLDNKCLKTFGFKPISPVGGTYTIDPETSLVSDSILGNHQNTVFDMEKLQKSAGLQRFFATKEISLTLQFTPEGVITTVDIK